MPYGTGSIYIILCFLISPYCFFTMASTQSYIKKIQGTTHNILVIASINARVKRQTNEIKWAILGAVRYQKRFILIIPLRFQPKSIEVDTPRGVVVAYPRDRSAPPSPDRTSGTVLSQLHWRRRGCAIFGLETREILSPIELLCGVQKCTVKVKRIWAPRIFAVFLSVYVIWEFHFLLKSSLIKISSNF